MNKYSAITLFSLLFLLSSCFYGPKYYEKDGQMYVKGDDFKWGKYNQLIEGADPATFREMEYPFSLDANHVYYLSVTNRQKINILEGANPATFEVLDSYYCRDSLHVWFYRYRPIHLIPEVDSKAFHELDYGYAKTDSFVFSNGYVLEGRDPETFVVLDYPYTEDKNDIYYREKPIFVSDRESFMPVEKEDVLHYWAKDKNYVYYMGYHDNDSVVVRSPIADYDSFEAVNDHYARDRFQVYFQDSTLKGADPATFLVLDLFHARDAKSVYFQDKRICHYDSSSFKMFAPSLFVFYVTDGTLVFYKDKVIEYADVASFEVISNVWTKDKNHVYYEDSIIVDADPKTFEYLEGPFSRDKNSVFKKTKKVKDADPTTFEVRDGYERDKYLVFYHDEIVEGADPATFLLIKWENDSIIGQDKYREYKLKR